MANTIKLGNGNWATKEGSLLAYNDENNNFKPLPFTTTRASSATVVNKQGLIETVGSGIPRIDFSDDANGALLLEPTATNLIVQSEDFSNAYWAKSSSSVVSGFTSPKGDLSAFKLTEDTSNGVHYIIVNTITGVSVNTFTSKVYAKKGERSWINLVLYDGATKQIDAYFDLENGVTGTSTNAISTNIKQLVNGWYECSMTYTLIASSAKFQPYIRLAKSNNVASYQGNGTSGVYIFGAQLEQNSYATSYIKTVGTTQTRVADTATGSGNSTVINSTQGVLYAEMSALSNDGTNRIITISDDSYVNSARIQFYANTNEIEMRMVVGGVVQALERVAITNVLDYNKIALVYSINDFALWINGSRLRFDTNGSVPIANTFNVVNFNDGDGSAPFYGKVKSLQVYTTALTDAELISLTTI